MNKEAAQIQRMFASIARRYDLANRVLSLSLDRYWRRRAVLKLEPFLPHDALVLDLCTGTGDLALELSKLAQVVGCDFCRPMLTLGQKKAERNELRHGVEFVEGDALSLPFPSHLFDAVTIAFGLRNLENYHAGLREIYRVLRPSGSLLMLEFSQPQVPIFRYLYFFYFTYILPRLGQLVSGESGPYSYLPQSVTEFPDPRGLEKILRQEGFMVASRRAMTWGVVSLYVGTKQEEG